MAKKTGKDRSTSRKIWDKATQIGMGAKAFAKEAFMDKYKFDSPKKDPLRAATEAYKKEKRQDESEGTKVFKRGGRWPQHD
tara:strand:- start:746 stop:988 length:243 start_codon:yes stop_codon:yes gene_type:complete